MNNKFKGTQGKWKTVECSFGEKQIHIQQQNGCRSLAIIPFYNESDANAQLIASAPELLKRLQSLMLSVMAHPDYFSGEEGDEWHDLISLSEETVNKALGI